MSPSTLCSFETVSTSDRAEDDGGEDTERADEQCEGFEDSEQAHLWQDKLSYTEKVKLHLARALIMNPEVMVLQRPLHHFDADTGMRIFHLLKHHTHNRGLLLPESSSRRRRPRTCFFAPETAAQAKDADVVWQIDDQIKTVVDVTSPGMLGQGVVSRGPSVSAPQSRRPSFPKIFAGSMASSPTVPTQTRRII